MEKKVLVVGAGRAGKSSLTCYLKGAKKLKWEKAEEKYHLHNESRGQFPEINNNGRLNDGIPTGFGKYIDCTGIISEKKFKEKVKKDSLLT